MDRRPLLLAAFVALTASCQFATPTSTARPVSVSRAVSIPAGAVKHTSADVS
jgi:hypothetical protein